MRPFPLSRRLFLSLAAAPVAWSKTPGAIPLGLELYSVRKELAQDPMGTIRAVAKMGYQGVEFFSPYFDWTPAYAKEIRHLLDDLGIQCFSTHNGLKSFTAEGLPKAIELNQALGSKYVVLASAGKPTTLDAWRTVAETLTRGAGQLKTAGLRAGYHNHQLEFTPVEGKRPLEVLADNTPADVMMQLDVGTCLEAGSDPVAWINSHPGRIRSLHLKDWSPEAGKGYQVLFGEGSAPWAKILAAAEKTGGVEYYLIEQEGSALPALETAQRCLASFRQIRQG